MLRPPFLARSIPLPSESNEHESSAQLPDRLLPFFPRCVSPPVLLIRSRRAYDARTKPLWCRRPACSYTIRLLVLFSVFGGTGILACLWWHRHSCLSLMAQAFLPVFGG